MIIMIFILNILKNSNTKSAIKEIIKVYNDGYSVIDIFYFYYNYVKNNEKISDSMRFIIISSLCNYISLINNNYEDEIELVLFTNKVNEKLQTTSIFNYSLNIRRYYLKPFHYLVNL